MLVEHAFSGRSCERWLPGQHLVEHARQAVHVAPSVERVPDRLLGAHVRGRSYRDPGVGKPWPTGGRDRARDPEVAHNSVAGLEEDVLGLDVAVHNVVT